MNWGLDDVLDAAEVFGFELSKNTSVVIQFRKKGKNGTAWVTCIAGNFKWANWAFYPRVGQPGFKQNQDRSKDIIEVFAIAADYFDKMKTS